MRPLAALLFPGSRSAGLRFAAPLRFGSPAIRSKSANPPARGPSGESRQVLHRRFQPRAQSPAPRSVPSAGLAQLQHIRDDAKLLGRETVDSVPCLMLETPGRTSAPFRYSPTTYWIDPARDLVLKSACTYSDSTSPNPRETSVTVYYPKTIVGDPIDETVFRFTPPPNSVEVERLTFGPVSPLTGKQAPDFELRGADGSAITSAGLRGSVVILQFGTPDPFLELLWRALHAKGLAVISVMPARYRPPSDRGLYTIPSAVDPGDVAAKFGFSFSGTVVIDRQGRIVYAASIARNQEEMASACRPRASGN